MDVHYLWRKWSKTLWSIYTSGYLTIKLLPLGHDLLKGNKMKSDCLSCNKYHTLFCCLTCLPYPSLYLRKEHLIPHRDMLISYECPRDSADPQIDFCKHWLLLLDSWNLQLDSHIYEIHSINITIIFLVLILLINITVNWHKTLKHISAIFFPVHIHVYI